MHENQVFNQKGRASTVPSKLEGLKKLQILFPPWQHHFVCFLRSIIKKLLNFGADPNATFLFQKKKAMTILQALCQVMGKDNMEILEMLVPVAELPQGLVDRANRPTKRT